MSIVNRTCHQKYNVNKFFNFQEQFVIKVNYIFQVEIKGTPLPAFKHLLKYIYTGYFYLNLWYYTKGLPTKDQTQETTVRHLYCIFLTFAGWPKCTDFLKILPKKCTECMDNVLNCIDFFLDVYPENVIFLSILTHQKLIFS